MIRLTIISFAMISVIGFYSCNKSKEDLLPSDYIKWVEDPKHGLHKTNSTEHFKISLQYKPYDYVIALQERTNDLGDSVAQQGRKELSGFQYYTLRIQSKNGEDILSAYITDPAESDYRLNYCTSVITNDLFLLTGSDTIPCAFCHFERNYALSDHHNFVLAFDSHDKPNQDREIVFADNGFTGELHRFAFKQNDLQNIPTLKTTRP